MPPDPAATEIAHARTLLLDELLTDISFVSEVERAHAVAALLLPFCRELIEGPMPLHLIEKPSAGTGGSLLADVLMRPALGRPLPAMTAGRDSDEWRKRLTAILSESPPAVLFDNVRRLDSDDLAAVLTATIFGSERFGRLRCVVTRANLQPAVAAYLRRPGDSAWRALALDVLRIEDGVIAEIVTFPPDCFLPFGLRLIMDEASEVDTCH